MSKRGLLIATAIFSAVAVGSSLWGVHNGSLVATKSIQAFGVGETPAVNYWDILATAIPLLLGGSSGIGAIITTVLAFIRKEAPAVIDRVLPGTSDNAKASTLDVAQIGLIQAALKAVKDEATRKSLNDAGRSAFDDLKNRTFPVEVAA